MVLKACLSGILFDKVRFKVIVKEKIAIAV